MWPLYLLPLAFGALMGGVHWLLVRGEAGQQWLPPRVGTDHVAPGSYRSAEVPRYGAPRPHAAALLAALGSWMLGWVFVPTFLLGSAGVLTALLGALLSGSLSMLLVGLGLGLVGCVMLVLQVRLLLVGAPILRGESAAAGRARAVARFGAWFGVVVLLTSGAAVRFLACAPGTGLNRGMGYEVEGVRMFSLVAACFALLTLAHAWGLTRAAKAIEERATEGASLTAVRVGVGASSDPEGAVEEGDRVDAASARGRADR